MIGDKLATAMQLFGNPSCINTAKCLQTAGEKGVDVEVTTINSGDEVADKSPLSSAPVLKDLDNVVYGTGAILSYLDDKGFGPSLVPRNGVIRAIMYQYSHIATDYVQMEAYGLLTGSGGNMDLVNKACDILENLFTNPPQHSAPKLKKDVYICGEFSLADIHWMSCVNALEISGNDVVSSRAAMTEWYNAVKSHPSISKENVVPYDFLPTKEDVDLGKVRNVGINVL
jgi:glutathione S-transferase